MNSLKFQSLKNDNKLLKVLRNRLFLNSVAILLENFLKDSFLGAFDSKDWEKLILVSV